MSGIGRPMTGAPDILRDWRFSQVEDELTDIAARELALCGLRADEVPIQRGPEPAPKPTFSQLLKEFLQKQRQGGIEHIQGK